MCWYLSTFLSPRVFAGTSYVRPYSYPTLSHFKLNYIFFILNFNYFKSNSNFFKLSPFHFKSNYNYFKSKYIFFKLSCGFFKMKEKRCIFVEAQTLRWHSQERSYGSFYP